MSLEPVNFLALMHMLNAGEITSRVAKDLLPELMEKNCSPERLAAERGLLRSNDTDKLASVVSAVITDNPQIVAEYRAGKTAVIQFLVGQVMKASKGTADPVDAKKVLLTYLD